MSSLKIDDDGKIDVRVVAVKNEDIGGYGMGAVIAHAESSDEVVVHPFNGLVSFDQFVGLFKRFSMTVLTRNLNDVKVNVQL